MDSRKYNIAAIIEDIENQIWAQSTVQTFEPCIPEREAVEKAIAEATEDTIVFTVTVGCGDDYNGVINYLVELEAEIRLSDFRNPKTFFGFALSDSMFAEAGACDIRRKPLTLEEVRKIIEAGVTPCLNPSHRATIDAMRNRFGIDVPIPESPPRVELNPGDRVVIMGVRGLPRLTDRHEYTSTEVAEATFNFSVYEVLLNE
ncbi:hypothetical protein IKT18_00600 [Candidatus Saccharibacteria bacterium]|nr:hypothetical protein [Candidatus Saccharibacteria bacterium]